MIECDTLIVIGSCAKYADRRKACRNTWCKHMPKAVKYFFFIGGGDTTGEAYIKEDEPDVVVLPCDDDYMALPRKTFNCFKYVKENYEFKYLLKCDDDTYVVPERVLYLDGYKDLVSHSWCNHLSGGAGYLLSKASVYRVVSEYQISPPRHWAEDVMVQEILVDRFHMEPRKCKDFHYDHFGLWPDKHNTIITIHYAGPLVMEACDRLLYGPVLTTCDVLFDGKKTIYKCYFYKSEITGKLRYVINGSDYHGECHLDAEGNLILVQEYTEKVKDENGKETTTQITKECKLIHLPGDFWEDSQYGPIGIVTPLDPEIFTQNDLPAKQESDTLPA